MPPSCAGPRSALSGRPPRGTGPRRGARRGNAHSGWDAGSSCTARLGRERCARGDRRLVLEPGGAFGTGRHPTTRACLAGHRTAHSRRVRPCLRLRHRQRHPGGRCHPGRGATPPWDSTSTPAPAIYARELARVQRRRGPRSEWRTGGFEILGPGGALRGGLRQPLLRPDRAAHADGSWAQQPGSPGGWFVVSGCTAERRRETLSGPRPARASRCRRRPLPGALGRLRGGAPLRVTRPVAVPDRHAESGHFTGFIPEWTQARGRPAHEARGATNVRTRAHTVEGTRVRRTRAMPVCGVERVLDGDTEAAQELFRAPPGTALPVRPLPRRAGTAPARRTSSRRPSCRPWRDSRPSTAARACTRGCAGSPRTRSAPSAASAGPGPWRTCWTSPRRRSTRCSSRSIHSPCPTGSSSGRRRATWSARR